MMMVQAVVEERASDQHLFERTYPRCGDCYVGIRAGWTTASKLDIARLPRSDRKVLRSTLHDFKLADQTFGVERNRHARVMSVSGHVVELVSVDLTADDRRE